MYICTMKQNHKGKVLFVIITSILLTLCTQIIFAQKIKDGKANTTVANCTEDE